MKSDFLIISIIILVILISGCTQTGYVVSPEGSNVTNSTSTTTRNNINAAITATTTTTIIKTNATNAASSAGSNQAKQCPATCNDNNSCTEDKCSAATNYECTYKAITPCCGNSVCEENEICNDDCTINVTIAYIHFESPEWVEINNSGNAANLTGWTLEDIVPHTYKFPDFILYPNSSVKVHTESGSDNQTDLYWNRGDQVWNDGGDNATLKDKEGNIISKYSYPLTTTTTTTTTSSTTTTTPTTTTSTSTTMPTTTTSSTTSSTTTSTASTTTTTMLIDHLIISEVYYDSISSYGTGEWVELYNPTPGDISLDIYSLSDNHDTIYLNITIASSTYIIIAKNATIFYDLYFCYPDIEGMTLDLADNGDNLTLKRADTEIDFVAWKSDNWNISAEKNQSILRKYGIDTDIADDWLSNQIPQPSCA